MSTSQPSAGLQMSGFHDAECAGYVADIPLWLALADTVGGPILDLGAGTGRVTLPLLTAGHEVIGVDLEPDLLDELRRRADALGLPPAETVSADLRTLDERVDVLGRRAALVMVPMQTIQLLGGPDGRRAMFRAAAAVAASDAELVISVVTTVEPFDGRAASPPLLPPDVAQLDGFRFESTPRAVLQERETDRIDMHRRRAAFGGDGRMIGEPEDVVITLDPVTISGLQQEAATAGWQAGEVIEMRPTDEHAGSTIVAFRRAGASV